METSKKCSTINAAFKIKLLSTCQGRVQWIYALVLSDSSIEKSTKRHVIGFGARISLLHNHEIAAISYL
jgi:hypothetical protein